MSVVCGRSMAQWLWQDVWKDFEVKFERFNLLASLCTCSKVEALARKANPLHGKGLWFWCVTSG